MSLMTRLTLKQKLGRVQSVRKTLQQKVASNVLLQPALQQRLQPAL